MTEGEWQLDLPGDDVCTDASPPEAPVPVNIQNQQDSFRWISAPAGLQQLMDAQQLAQQQALAQQAYYPGGLLTVSSGSGGLSGTITGINPYQTTSNNTGNISNTRYITAATSSPIMYRAGTANVDQNLMVWWDDETR